MESERAHNGGQEEQKCSTAADQRMPIRCLQNNYSGFFLVGQLLNYAKRTGNDQIGELCQKWKLILRNFPLKKFPVLWQKKFKGSGENLHHRASCLRPQVWEASAYSVIATFCLLSTRRACRRSPRAAVFMGHDLSQGCDLKGINTKQTFCLIFFILQSAS